MARNSHARLALNEGKGGGEGGKTARKWGNMMTLFSTVPWPRRAPRMRSPRVPFFNLRGQSKKAVM